MIKGIKPQEVDVWREAKEWIGYTNVHPSRLLKPESFLLQEKPIYENGTLDLPAALMLFQANRFLASVRDHLTGIVREYASAFQFDDERTELNQVRLNEIPLEKLLSGESDQFIISLLSACDMLSDWAAPISVYLLENHPECKSFVESDKSRFEPFNWIEFMLRYRKKKDRLAYGFVENKNGTINWTEDAGSFDTWDIKLTEDEFFQVAHMVPGMTEEINFAVRSACTLINYMSWGLAMFEAKRVADRNGLENEERECFLQETEGTFYQPAETDGPHFLCRKIQIVYQGKTFKSDEGIIRAFDVPKNLAPGCLGEWFVKNNCPKLSKQARAGLGNLKKSEVSYRFKGKELDEWKERAVLYEEYMQKKLMVLRWFYSRVEIITSKQYSEAMIFLQTHYKKFEFSDEQAMTLFIDQRLVSDALERGDKVTELSVDSFKDDQDAIMKLSPILEKYKLKIVPIDEEVLSPLSVASSLKAASDIDLSKAPYGLNTDLITPNPKVLKYLTEDLRKPMLPQAPSGILTEISKNPVIKDDPYEKEKQEDSKLQKWENTPEYKQYFKDLGGQGQCTPIDIARAKMGKEDLEKIPKVKARAIGRKFCKEFRLVGTNIIQPIQPVYPNHPYNEMMAMAETLATAYKKVNNPKIPYHHPTTDENGNKIPITATEDDVKRGYATPIAKVKDKGGKSKYEEVKVSVKEVGEIVYSKRPNLNPAEMTEAVNAFKKDAEKKKDLDKVFLKHLKKIVGRKEEDTTPYIEQAASLVGFNPIQQNSKWKTSEIAIALCEHARGNEDNNGQ